MHGKATKAIIAVFIIATLLAGVGIVLNENVNNAIAHPIGNGLYPTSLLSTNYYEDATIHSSGEVLDTGYWDVSGWGNAEATYYDTSGLGGGDTWQSVGYRLWAVDGSNTATMSVTSKPLDSNYSIYFRIYSENPYHSFWNIKFGNEVDGWVTCVSNPENNLGDSGYHSIYIRLVGEKTYEVYASEQHSSISVQLTQAPKLTFFVYNNPYGENQNAIIYWDNIKYVDELVPPPLFIWVDNNYNSSTPGWQYDHFDNIQDGINAVAENGTVYVYNGTYYENVIINKTIDLIGENRNGTIIDGSWSNDVLQVSKNRVLVEKFTIKNCGNGRSGIVITSSNNTILNCNFLNNHLYGIKFSFVSYNIVSNCNFLNNNYSILFYNSSNNIVTKNNISSNTVSGIISVESSNNNTVSYCNIYSNKWHGIVVGSSCNKNIIKYCNIYDNGNTGIAIFDSCFNTITNCQLSYNWGGISTLNDCYNSIYGCNISDNTRGVYFWGSSSNIIEQCQIQSNKWEGIRFDSSTNNRVSICNVTSNNDYGIYLYSLSKNNSIYGCTVSYSDYGIFILEADHNLVSSSFINSNNMENIGVFKSDSNTFFNCTINSSNYGIHLSGTCNNSLISNCSIFSHSYDGILISGPCKSNNTCISHCDIYDNLNGGIQLFKNNGNHTISSCNLLNNAYGIISTDSNNSLIYNNYFENNKFNVDDWSLTFWNVTKTLGTNIIGGSYLGGNYWNDYSGVDTNGDGIGDTNLPYNCYGNIQNGGDWLPLVEPNYLPVTNFSYAPLNPTDLDTVIFTIHQAIVMGVLSTGHGTLVMEQSHTSRILHINMQMMGLTM